MNEIEDIGDNKSINLKEKISNFLFDKTYIDMITKVQINEIHNLSVLAILVNGENKIRMKLNLENNILGDVINKNLLLRTSLNGWRSEQAVTIIKSNLEEDTKTNTGLFGKLKNIINR